MVSQVFKIRPGLSYKVTASARGYYDKSVNQVFTAADTTLELNDLTVYDGLTYTTDSSFDSYMPMTVNFSGTTLPNSTILNDLLDNILLNVSGNTSGVQVARQWRVQKYESVYTNITTTGSPTISNGVVSGFTSSNYFDANSDTYGSGTTEIVAKFSTSASGSGVIFHKEYFANLEFSGLNVTAYSWSGGTTTLFTATVGTVYWVKCVIDQTAQTKAYSYSTDGVTYTDLATLTDTSMDVTSSYNLRWGRSSYSSSTAFTYGSIYLDDCYIVTDGTTFNLDANTKQAVEGEYDYYGYGLLDNDYTDTGAAVTLNCFYSPSNSRFVLSEKETYGTYTYLGTVDIPEHTVVYGEWVAITG